MVTYDPIIQPIFSDSNYQVNVLRLDQLHENIPGNKWFKLKYNLERAKKEDLRTILTFGGAYSNHIAATAAAVKLAGFSSVGVIRGEETNPLNSTLLLAKENGMQIHFISRELYSKKNEPNFLNQLQEKFGPFYLIPEGGSNKEGILGCMEILDRTWDYDYIFCACGTGSTYAGLVLSAPSSSVVIGINVLKGQNSTHQAVNDMLTSINPSSTVSISGNEALEKTYLIGNCITDQYAFSGYAGYHSSLVEFKWLFEKQYGMVLDHLYTNKVFYAVFDLMKLQKLPLGSKILVIHTGGQQANESFEKRYHLKLMR
ncbi:MAG: pyridoxal-phosphate dependent enzyme [bacterium]|nr:pyridoxal-phosphate dependent enzyme [bacterium]